MMFQLLSYCGPALLHYRGEVGCIDHIKLKSQLRLISGGDGSNSLI